MNTELTTRAVVDLSSTHGRRTTYLFEGSVRQNKTIYGKKFNQWAAMDIALHDLSTKNMYYLIDWMFMFRGLGISLKKMSEEKAHKFILAFKYNLNDLFRRLRKINGRLAVPYFFKTPKKCYIRLSKGAEAIYSLATYTKNRLEAGCKLGAARCGDFAQQKGSAVDISLLNQAVSGLTQLTKSLDESPISLLARLDTQSRLQDVNKEKKKT